LQTNDVVHYDPNGNTPISTPGGDLGAGFIPGSNPPVHREYDAIVVDQNTLKLGATFNAVANDTSDLFNPLSGVDNALGVMRFSTEHNFQTGDSVIYDTRGNAAITSATNPLYVRRIDDFT